MQEVVPKRAAAAANIYSDRKNLFMSFTVYNSDTSSCKRFSYFLTKRSVVEYRGNWSDRMLPVEKSA